MATVWSDVEQSQAYQSLPAQEQQAAKQQYFSQVVAQKPEFQQLPDNEKQAAASQFLSNSIQNSVDSRSVFKKVSDFADSTVDFSNTGIAQLTTGKSLQDRALDATKPNIPQAMSAPYDANITTAKNNQFGDIAKGTLAGSAGTIADTLTSTSSLAFAAAKPVVATGKAIGEGANNIAQFFNFDQKALTLSDKVRAVAAQAKQNAVNQFGDSLDALAKANPSKSISLQHVIDNIKNNQDLPYEANAVFNKTPILRDMLKNPNDQGYISPSSVSLKDTQEIINYINTKIPRSIKANSLDILDAQNDIRAAQLHAFPEMDVARAQYGKFAEDYKLIKSVLNPKSTPGAIVSNFNNNPAVKDAASRVLAPVIGDMSKFRGQVSAVNMLKKLVGAGIIGGAGVVGAGGAVEAYKRFKP